MLKIKDSVDLKELDDKYNLETEIIDGDYECDVPGDIEHSKGGVFISEINKMIYGIDVSDLDLLYHLTKEDLVEEVQDES